MKLVVAEKPSVARDIAHVIGASKKEEGYLSGNGYLVTWCFGHLIELAMPEDYDPSYEKWDLCDLPIIPEEWKHNVTQSSKTQYKIVKDHMNRTDVEEIVCATDAGREGELIFRLVYHQARCKKPVKRLWISSMVEQAIAQGMDHLVDSERYDSLYQAALARLHADWLVGINMTRLFTCLYHKTVNVGRVQTPTINMIVQRQKAIEAFISEPYYILSADCNGFKATRREDDRTASEDIIRRCNGQSGTITEVIKTIEKVSAPRLYDLTTLQREANRYLGMTAQQTLDAAQKLYEKKLISYPRTDSQYLTSEMDRSTLEIIESILDPADPCVYLNMKTPAAYDINRINIQRLLNDKKVTDHHAIIPTMLANDAPADLKDDEAKIFTLILYRLLMAAYTHNEFEKTDITVEIANEEFKASGKHVLQAGWKSFEADLFELTKSAAEQKDNGSIPEVLEGMKLHSVKIDAETKQTQPQKPYTEETLLSAMENASNSIEDERVKKEMKDVSLGTPATRAGIIERIIGTGFIEREKKNLRPTSKALDLIEVVPEIIKSPELTGAWEHQLELIAGGHAGADEFMTSIEMFVTELTTNYKTAGVQVDRFTTEKEVIGKCPRCGKNIYEGKLNFYCEGGKACGFTMWKNDKFFSSKKKELTKRIAITMLKIGRIEMKGLYSEKKDKTYDGVVQIKDTGTYVNYELVFDEPKPKKGGLLKWKK